MTSIAVPGASSRTASIPVMSKAGVSLEKAVPPDFVLPSQSGRKPCGSRTATIPDVVRMRREKAPRSSRAASTTRSSGSSEPPVRARRWRMTSESAVAWKIEPRSSNSRRREGPFVRFPL